MKTNMFNKCKLEPLTNYEVDQLQGVFDREIKLLHEKIDSLINLNVVNENLISQMKINEEQYKTALKLYKIIDETELKMNLR